MVTKKATTTKAKVRVTKEKAEPKTAEGKKFTASAWNERIAGITADSIPGFQQNILYQQALNTALHEVFTAPPEVWVTDPENEIDEKLTAELREEFDRLGCYELMHAVLRDVFGNGCAVFSVGAETIGGKYTINEIKHLSAYSFRNVPADYNPSTGAMPNEYMPGIITNADDEVEVWQTQGSGIKVQINNFTIVKAIGSPEPSGMAFMKPVYPLIAHMDFCQKALTQQVSRVGAPILFAKVEDDVTESDLDYLTSWGNQFLRSWGKNTAALIPQGIEIPPTNIHESNSAKEAMEMDRQWILDYVNPMSTMQQTGNLGASDTGRMELWVTTVISRQSLCEVWLEKIFNKWLLGNGYEGYKANIELKRPGLDRNAIKLQYMVELANRGAITKKEIRENSTDVVDLQDTTDELLEDLKTEYPVQQTSALSLFTNTNDGFKGKEKRQVEDMQEDLRTINDATFSTISKILNYPTD